MIMKVVAALLICSAIYGSFYSVLLIWKKEDITEVGDGFQTRTVHTADQIVQVAFITREERLAGAVTLMNSIVSNTKSFVHFSIITDNSSVDHLWEWIENSKLKTVSYQVTALTSDWISKNMNIVKDEAETLSYARLFFSKIFSSLKSRVIFLDDDIIVQGDINELFHTSILPGQVGAFSVYCDDLPYSTQGNRFGNLIFSHKAPLRPLQLNSSACTFSLNAYVINVLQWEKQNISQNAVHWIEVHKRIRLYKDEGPLCPLLLALNNKISFLDADWKVKKLDGDANYDKPELSKFKLLLWDGAHKSGSRSKDESTDLWNTYYVPDPASRISHSHNV